MQYYYVELGYLLAYLLWNKIRKDMIGRFFFQYHVIIASIF